MSATSAIDALSERIKELSCLYDISSIASDHSDNLEEALQAITVRIAKAWKHADDAVAEIKMGDRHYQSGPLPIKTVYTSAAIVLDREHIGIVRIHYPTPQYTQKDFLTEEELLLKKIAQEIGTIYERHQRIEREEILKRSAERNDRLTILGEITAGIAHELNTPLGNILGFSELIAGKTREEQIRKDALKITSSAMHAREVVKKLMFFSCEMPQQMESIALNPLVEDALNLLKPSLQSAGVNIHFEPDPKNPFGRLDPIQITQVIFNLIINAIHASPAGSTISIKLLSADKKLNIIIADQGHGIPEAARDKIFEPFFTTKGVGEGSGLGLSVVHGIVKSHQGSIRFSSEEGTGTTFNISLPLQP